MVVSFQSDERLPEGARSHVYKYCWDLDIYGDQLPVTDPECRRWDRGSNPVQMVNAFIDQLNSRFTTGAYRYDRKYMDTDFIGTGSAFPGPTSTTSDLSEVPIQAL